MPQNMRDIKRRIKSVRNTSQITKAMEMVAAAKLRRVQDAVQQSKPYLAKMQDMLANLSQSARHVKHPLLASRPVKRTGYLVITADRGLAGPYNAQVVRAAMQEFGKKDKASFAIYAVGKRGRDYFRRRGFPVAADVVDLADSPTYHSIRHLAEAVVSAYERAEFDELYFIYNEFINAASQRPIVKKVLPLDSLADEAKGPRRIYEFEPDEEAVLAALLPRYAETLVYQAVLDAKASEHAARMTAMGNATDNAKELISDLTLSLNRARQAAITTQIAEIVGGAEALR
ncbi:ATP synthase F1, gamma subunit [Alicyclobacillus hesperidum URH17-3-68]|uniref:ATP synthase gamma chain n=1 Tax=Alicyclobacillus hesperidum TaxID=89784 RepID=A0A1H2XBH2_9BACL|nr:ATP synthase F1 subunit gamma [Alicyclobacillus hesperidum]KRW92318.1 ATP F0F1 synthase subunit gamma [Alicyclobacillus tengchongensis]EJY56618.1 ATP synthase F1, gamma subunit [Alicyclobacillus hesperidum URH17-3-68]SDW89814.1 ATP synthase F1 subcomplex gamma subunit [Alicyclobacillus hesperidum]GLG02017.1 ATP synthase gamma chain [Alicyclobacillus hesperidum subsp. aegles]GLV14207.1 ATP synthase gamma chain [Alicyclobacillus hesperidum]